MNDENRTPSAWVWSQYRGIVTGAPNAAHQTPDAVSGTRERPPLIPEKSGRGTGALLAALVLLAAGLTWWFSPHEPAASSEPATEAADVAPSDGAEANSAEANAAAPDAPAEGEPAEAARPAPMTAAEKLAAARQKLAALPSAGALDAAACETALNATVTVEKIQFRSGRAVIERASNALLGRLADLLKRCPDVTTEIVGYTDNVGSEASNHALSQRRADAVAAWLKKAGVARARLSAIGHGPENPVASNDTEEGRAENRRIEFSVK